MQLILLTHEVKLHKLHVCCKINLPSTQQLIIHTFVQVQEGFEVLMIIFLFQIKIHLCNTTQQILKKVTKSHTKIFCSKASFMNTYTTSNNGMMQVKPMTTSMSKRQPRFFFVVAITFMSSFILTTKVMYFTITHLTRDNMETHIVFTLHNSFNILVQQLGNNMLFKMHFW